MQYDIDRYMCELDRLSQHRRVHSLNVSKEAARLAARYGADVKKARIAGLLHDITKETPPEEQLKIITDGGIILTDVERASSKLWHAISGSVYLRDVLSFDDADILNAVRYHTTGRAGMSLLEKVIFVADFTSAERDYEDIDVIRRYADRSLDQGAFYGLRFTLSRLSGRGSPISPDALSAYNEIALSLLEGEDTI